MPEVYPSRTQARWAWRILVTAGLATLFVYMISITSPYESRRERTLRGLHASQVSVAILLSSGEPRGLRHSLSGPGGPVQAVCTIKPKASDKDLQAALGPALSKRLNDARSVDSDYAAIVMFYDEPTVVLRATDLSHDIRFSVARTVCSTNVPTLVVRGRLRDKSGLIDVETFE